MIPILSMHDHTKVIGQANPTDKGLLIELAEPMIQNQFEEIFGFCGYTIEEHDVDRELEVYIKKAIIHEWSNPHSF